MKTCNTCRDDTCGKRGLDLSACEDWTAVFNGKPHAEVEVTHDAEATAKPSIRTSPLRVFIAGPLNDNACGYLANTHAFLVADRELRRHKFAPFNPAADLLTGLYAGDMEYADYADPNLAFVEVCDAMLFLGPSPGADRERERANECGVPVFGSVSAIVDWRDGA
jgi:hypothetical protein